MCDELSDNALVSINVVTLRWARLVPGWVTVSGQVNYLGMKPATTGQLSLAIPLWVSALSTSLGWEGNCRSGVSLAMRHMQTIVVYPSTGLTAYEREMSTPRLCSVGVWPPFTFTAEFSFSDVNRKYLILVCIRTFAD